MPRGGLSLEHRAFQVDIKDEIKLILGEVFGLLFTIQADAVYQNIQRAEMVRHFIDHALRFGDGEYVEGGGVGVAAEFADGGGSGRGLFAIAAGNRHLGACCGEAAADGIADTAVSTRDQCGFAIEAEEAVRKGHVHLPTHPPSTWMDWPVR